MAKNKNQTKQVPLVTPHRYTPEEFLKEYQELCKKTGLQIGFEPRWVRSQDQGDYRLAIQLSVVPIS